MDGAAGTANFGQKYNWTARPAALSLRYKAKVGTIDSNGMLSEEYIGQQDTSRIYVAIVDWSAQHGVLSGMVENPTGMWDPASATSVSEGKILGYGDLLITKNVDSWTNVELKINWYDKDAGIPSSDKYSIVISCATSLRGDYLTGCKSNQMWVDDFEWVY